ncbi:MAG: fatty acid desaturase family protein [Alphaproteobacteria bacterium]
MAANGPIHGEEFIDDLRSPVAAKVNQLPPERHRELSQIDTWRAIAAVVGTMSTLIGTIAIALLVWNPIFVVIAIIIIGTRQHALIVLAHDATHYRLFKPRWLNDLIGRMCGMVSGVSMCSYRVIHRLHHNHLYQDQDPDIPLHGGYPRGRTYLAKKLLRDLCGFTAWKTYAYFFGAPSINTTSNQSSRPLDDTSSRLRQSARHDRYLVAGFHLTALTAALAIGHGLEYLLLWVLPLATIVPALLRLRAVCEHGAVIDFTSPLGAARTNLSPIWLQWLLFPHHVNYHLEHHIYPAIPHYNLPSCHREMVELGVLDNAEVRTIKKTLGLLFADPPTTN